MRLTSSGLSPRSVPRFLLRRSARLRLGGRRLGLFLRRLVQLPVRDDIDRVVLEFEAVLLRVLLQVGDCEPREARVVVGDLGQRVAGGGALAPVEDGHLRNAERGGDLGDGEALGKSGFAHVLILQIKGLREAGWKDPWGDSNRNLKRCGCCPGIILRLSPSISRSRTPCLAPIRSAPSTAATAARSPSRAFSTRCKARVPSAASRLFSSASRAAIWRAPSVIPTSSRGSKIGWKRMFSLSMSGTSWRRAGWWC